jgi:hypothetical protein
MNGLIAQLLAWPTLGVAILAFGFAPGVALRLIVLLYPRGNPRRRELLGELYAVPTIERPFWVAAQLELALFEGLRTRFRAWRDKQVAKPTAERAESGSASEMDIIVVCGRGGIPTVTYTKINGTGYLTHIGGTAELSQPIGKPPAV